MPGTEEHYDVVVIGSGFAGPMTALALGTADAIIQELPAVAKPGPVTAPAT